MKMSNRSPLSVFGKDLNEMTYEELKAEHEVYYWWTWFLRKVIFEKETKTISYDKAVQEQVAEKLRDANERYEKGEISQYSLFLYQGQAKRKTLAVERRYQRVEFLKQMQYDALAHKELLKERLAVKPKPKKKYKSQEKKRKHSPYKRKKFKPRKSYTRRKYNYVEGWKTWVRWTKEQEKRPLGELWNKKAFMRVCANHGYVTPDMVQMMVSTETDCSMVQAKYMIDNGCFTWLQIMLIGAALQITPTEFAEVFMSGYFVEIGHGIYQASYDKIPEEAIMSKPMEVIKSEDDKSQDF